MKLRLVALAASIAATALLTAAVTGDKQPPNRAPEAQWVYGWSTTIVNRDSNQMINDAARSLTSRMNSNHRTLKNFEIVSIVPFDNDESGSSFNGGDWGASYTAGYIVVFRHTGVIDEAAGEGK